MYLSYNAGVRHAVEDIGQCARIWEFVDGTFPGFYRPSSSDEAQHAVYNGQQFQAVVAPDGLPSSLCGLFPGTANDWMIRLKSGCEDRLEQVMEGKEMQKWLFLYGDEAYKCATGIMNHFTQVKGGGGGELALDERAFNRS